LAVLDLELVLADLAILDYRIEKVKGMYKAQPRAVKGELSALDDLREHLQAGNLASTWEGLGKARDYLEPVALVTDKPRLYVANVGEEDLPEGGPFAASVLARAVSEGARWVVVCAQLEADLAEWEPVEAAAYRSELGLAVSGLEALVTAAYATLDLMTFFTTTGEHEVRAWSLPQRTVAPTAAGHVHTDMERGFIRAEVLSFDDLDRAGSILAARERGLVRVEGREYIIQDGDVCHFRFNI
jgi:ribosome-binding ATPase YchF (GTP1/OBG family)